MSSAQFIDLLITSHLDKKAGKNHGPVEPFGYQETRWLSIYGIGRLEFYRFMYNHCNHVNDLREWLIDLKGADELAMADDRFEQYINRTIADRTAVSVTRSLLTSADLQHWQDHGFLKISGYVQPYYCDAVKEFICEYLHIDLLDKATWYPVQPDWHGLMLQIYQHPAMEAIRQHPDIRQIFEELYQTCDIVVDTDKVSYNPPETESWKFRHSGLHWDIDMSKTTSCYIQGLVYLDDVPEERGPLRVVPGFHHKYDNYIQQFDTPEAAQASIQQHLDAIPIPGKKGDIVLWQQTLPHAASANHSSLPRFVQYVSFTKL